jgi:hypothetical protein
MVCLLQSTKAMKIPLPLPSQEELHKLFEYKEGNLYWRIGLSNYAKNGRKAGTFSPKDYMRIQINYAKYYAHRIIWCYHFGPIADKLQIDHIDGDKTNNMIENLRLATNGQNKSNNKRAYRNSKSNILGVYWFKKTNKWAAGIRINNKRIHLGYFANQEDAIAIRKAAELQYFGEFAQ